MLDWTSRAVIIDCETTGLDPLRDQIIELSILRCGDGQMTTWRFNPTTDISERAFKIHRIAKGSLMNERTFSDLSQQILESIRDSMLIIGFHVRFDVAMLIAEFERSACGANAFPHIPELDIKTLLPKACPQRLQYAYQYLLRRPARLPHTSKGDATMIKELLDHLLSTPPFKDCSLDDILKFGYRRMQHSLCR